jgi:hypothetical protein
MKWVERWYVNSNSIPNYEYTVSKADDGETWGCSCKAWTLNRKRLKDGICSHIRKVQNQSHNHNVRHDDFFTEEEFTL